MSARDWMTGTRGEQVTTDKLDVAVGDASAGGAAALMPRLNELSADFSVTSRQLSRVLRLLEQSSHQLGHLACGVIALRLHSLLQGRPLG